MSVKVIIKIAASFPVGLFSNLCVKKEIKKLSRRTGSAARNREIFANRFSRSLLFYKLYFYCIANRVISDSVPC